MTHNDTLRRLRYALNINDAKIAELVARTDRETTVDEVVSWLKREDEAGYGDLSPALLCRFLDGLVMDRRGPHPSGKMPEPLEFLSNNEILKKLRIASLRICFMFNTLFTLTLLNFCTFHKCC